MRREQGQTERRWFHLSHLFFLLYHWCRISIDFSCILLVEQLWPQNIDSRVDVSEIFSTDQLWFRILSGPFQRCSLPENLWTALIQLWTALRTKIFRAKNQPWNSAVSVLISSETTLNIADIWIIQNDHYWLIFHSFQNFSKYLNVEADNFGIQPSLRKEVSNKNLLLHFRTGQRYNTYLNFWVYCYCSTNKTDMVQLFRNIFAFVGVCRGHLPGQSFLSSGYGRSPLQDEDHSGNCPRSFPSLYSMRSGRPPEWPCSNGFMRNHLDVIMRLVCSFLFYWTLLTTFLWPFPQFAQKLELCSLPAIWEQLSFVPSCS